MPDFPIGGIDVVAGDGVAAAQMRIRRFSADPFRQSFRGRTHGNRQARRVKCRSPQIGAAPVIGIPIIPEVRGLVLPGNRQVGVDVGALLNLILRQRHFQTLGFPVRMGYREWGDQYLPAAKPAAGFHRKIADAPRLIVEIELLHRSDLAILSLYGEALQMIRISQHRFGPPGHLPVRFGRRRSIHQRRSLTPQPPLRPSAGSR